MGRRAAHSRTRPIHAILEPPTLMPNVPTPTDAPIEHLTRELLSRDHLLLCLDYDGTLIGLTQRRELAQASPKLLSLLRLLREHPRITPVIVSGRSLPQLLELIPLEGLAMAGEHGMDVAAGSLRRTFEPDADVASAVLRVLERWRGVAQRHPGCLVQNKGRSGSCHFKEIAPGTEQQVEAEILEAGAAEMKAGLVQLTGGRRIVEMRPRGGWNKGDAVAMLADHYRRMLHTRSVMVAFIGDDLTDEDALVRLPTLRPSIGVRVSENPDVETAAEWRLATHTDVIELVEQLALGLHHRPGS